MSLSFSNFKTVNTANTKTGVARATGQSFNFRFKQFISKKGGVEKQDSFFQVSDKLFTELGLETSGLIQIVSPEGISYLAVVDNDHATVMKRTNKLKGDAEKGKKFKSSIIEKALADQKVIDLSIVGKSQKLELVKVSDATSIGEGEDAIPALAVYEVQKSEDTTEEEDDKTEETGVEEVPTSDSVTMAGTTEATNVPETPAQAPASATETAEDDF